MSTNTRIAISTLVVIVSTWVLMVMFAKIPPDLPMLGLAVAAGLATWGVTSVWAAPKQPPQA